jgi:hypothetical protein
VTPDKENANLDELIKFLKAEDEIVSNDIISAVTPDYEKICATGYISSVKVPSNDGYMITVTNKHQYSAITPTEKVISRILSVMKIMTIGLSRRMKSRLKKMQILMN